ncbi:hypothetical protein BCR44DRAFT_24125 [Catenaria anguillulae PL171]|uniref:Uncharacterized protein n=1 Tax=Catenaria anguillulae PL171 TaxID=765915 RepID=A0A1Y2HHG3_9FUNG|nr:hypothetical protein BCR44DRAFT_24125 [Catenaria anguillulae PL171]
MRTPNTPLLLPDTRPSSPSTPRLPTTWTVTQLGLPQTCNPHGTLNIPINKLVGTLVLVFLGTRHQASAGSGAEGSDNEGPEHDDEQQEFNGNDGQSTSPPSSARLEPMVMELAPKVVNIESLGSFTAFCTQSHGDSRLCSLVLCRAYTRTAFLGQVGPFTFSDAQLL